MDKNFPKSVDRPDSVPLVCLIDVDNSVELKMREDGFNCKKVTLGTLSNLSGRGREDVFLLNDFSIPDNLHEYDVVVVDLCNETVRAYDPSDHKRNDFRGHEAYYLLSRFPQTLFDPRPCSVNYLRVKFRELYDKESIILVFVPNDISIQYDLVCMDSSGTNLKSRDTYSSVRFYDAVPSYRGKTGKKIKTAGGGVVSDVLAKYTSDSKYGLVFEHPKEGSGGGYGPSKKFAPLLLNEIDEIVGYAHSVKKTTFIVLPDIKDKVGLLHDLMCEALPSIFSSIFPSHGMFGWLKGGGYPLPGEEALHKQRAELQVRFQRDIEDVDTRISEVQEEYKFLHDMISETGDQLVSSVVQFFKWVGFESVVDMDGHAEEVLEEDIQIEGDKGLLVVEVKGIGGTSKDKECSQILKIKYRRAEERGSFDVFGLYVVNHQRYVEPKQRINPPFTEHQVRDARLEKRALVTTYQLYKSYFMVQDGVADKSDIRDALYEYGVVNIIPRGLEFISLVGEIYQGGRIIIINIPDGFQLKVGDCLFVEKDGEYRKVGVSSIKADDVDQQMVTGGEVGVGLTNKVKKGSNIYIKKSL